MTLSDCNAGGRVINALHKYNVKQVIRCTSGAESAGVYNCSIRVSRSMQFSKGALSAPYLHLMTSLGRYRNTP